MKKIIPVIAVVGASALIVGISNKPNELKPESFINNINAFKEDVNDYTSLNEASLNKTALNKYKLSIQTENLEDFPTVHKINEDNDSLLRELSNTEDGDVSNEENTHFEENNNENNTENLKNNVDVDNEKLQQLSTLYSLSNDMEESCDEFCELKEDITNAILETQNLITKIQQKEVELTKEQRMFITEQSLQLKSLGRQLSNVTTELSIGLSDLSQIMATNNQNLDDLSLKYLVVLDNLVNGNEMLQSGLNSLNLINQMFNMRSTMPSNNQGRILYGFQHNNNPPVIKDYYIDENGKLVENQQTDNSNENPTENSENDQNQVEKTTNIDTYNNSLLQSNIDTYNNNNAPRNIDTFFNTALLDNEFMYGNGNYYGMNNMNGYANPYMNGYANYERNNTINSVNQENNTQNNTSENNSSKSNKEKKRIKLKKNIDTYKDENEPDIKTKLGNIKNSISGFFSKFKKSDLNDKIDNPIYRYNATNGDEQNS